jgi:hypothetical protein
VTADLNQGGMATPCNWLFAVVIFHELTNYIHIHKNYIYKNCQRSYTALECTGANII